MKNGLHLFLAIASCLPSIFASEADLSKRKLPTLSAKDAIDKAEAFIAMENIRKEGTFLTRVEYHELGPPPETKAAREHPGPYWQVTYQPDVYADGGQIFIMISMDGKARYMGGR